MTRYAPILIFVLVAPAAAQYDILYTDNYSSDTLGIYTQECYAGEVDSVNWQIVDGKLQGTSLSSGPCFAGILGHSTWDIYEVVFRIRLADGQSKGITIHNARGDIGLTMSDSPDNRLYFHVGSIPEYMHTTTHGFQDGVWLEFIIRIWPPDVDLFINRDYVFHLPGEPDLLEVPFEDVRFWVADTSTAEFDDLIIYGGGVSAEENVSWSTLKSFYR